MGVPQGARSRCVVVFYSVPVEASLSALFRSLEVCGGDRVFIVSTARRGSDAREVVSRVGQSVGVGAEPVPVFPDEDTAQPVEISRAVDIVKSVVSGCEEVCVDVSSGSRLEVATAIAAFTQLGSAKIFYTSFAWGPWKGLFYPLTPKPLQRVYFLAPGQSPPKPSTAVFQASAGDLLALAFAGPELRRRVAEAQYNINKQLDSLCYADSEGFECSCRGLEAVIYTGSTPAIRGEARDYCSWSDTVNAVAGVVDGFESRRDRLRNEQRKALELLLRVSGLYQLAVDECSYGCEDCRGVLFMDCAARGLGGRVIVDTNVVYGGIHTQLWEYMEQRYSIAIPYCALLELYSHEAQTRDAYEKLRSEVAHILLAEVSELKLPVDYRIVQRPCEVGMALESSPREVLATADVAANRRVFRDVKREAVLLTPTPLHKTRLLHSEISRKASYAYYAIAQLKALAEHRGVKEALKQLGLQVEVKML
jgi:hypothetical protein